MGAVFESISSLKMARIIENARERVIVAVPAFHSITAEALVRALEKLGGDHISVVVDCDEEVFRLGYGDIKAVQKVKDCGAEIRQCTGLRIGILICDDDAWTFSPTALYIQDEIHSDETPNAIRLSVNEAQRIVLGISPTAFRKDMIQDHDVIQNPQVEPDEVEIGIDELCCETMKVAEQSLEVAPPIPFDVARQVRVFESYIQYVDIKLHGCAIQRRKISIPKSILDFGTSSDFSHRLETVFTLIEKNSKMSSKSLDDELRDIKKVFTRSLGEPWGRVMLRAKRKELDVVIEQFREKVQEHQKYVEGTLKKNLNETRTQVIMYYLPRVMNSPSEQLLGQITIEKPTEEIAKKWLDSELQKVLPTVEQLLTEMRLEVTFRDVTYETLNNPLFAEKLKKSFPFVDWDKPFREFNAAHEKKREIGK